MDSADVWVHSDVFELDIDRQEVNIGIMKRLRMRAAKRGSRRFTSATLSGSVPKP